MINRMSMESLIHGDHPDEPLPVAVARRLRGQLAEYRMTLEDLGRVLGLSKMAASRRVNGETPISLAELELIEAASPITATYLLTGRHPEGPRVPPPPPSHPSLRPQEAGAASVVRRLHRVGSDVGKSEDRELVNAEVDDDAIAYLHLANDRAPSPDRTDDLRIIRPIFGRRPADKVA